jgi:hypothetical protein
MGRISPRKPISYSRLIGHKLADDSPALSPNPPSEVHGPLAEGHARTARYFFKRLKK